MNMTRGIAVSLITALVLIHGVPVYGWPGFSRTINGGGGGSTSYNGDLSTITTDNITEGTFNKYYMDVRARAALSASLPLSYNTSTGVFSLTTVPVTSGGTGLTTTPVKGQIFIGNDNGTFKLNTLNAGSNVTITNDNGSVTIAASTGGSPLWGNITGTLSAQSDLQSALNAKEPSIAAGTSGNWYNGTKNWYSLYSDNVTEGLNQYFTAARAVSAIGTSISGNWYNGTNNWFTLYTDNITQGTNLWYTDAAARAALSAGTGISYDNTTGVISATGGGGGGGSIGGIDNITLTSNQNGLAQVANWVINDIILAYFKLAVHAALTIFNMDDGIFDKFENQAGIDNRTVAWSDNV
ncbi:MAG: hypothetical protein H7843_16220, partial [Nitrospirota bacterium]